MAYVLIATTIGFTVAGQLLVKAGMSAVGPIPRSLEVLPRFILDALTNVSVFGGLAFAVLAAIAWMGAVSLSDISFAYPFMSLAIVLVLALAGVVLGEHVPLNRWLGVILVCLGLVVAAYR